MGLTWEKTEVFHGISVGKNRKTYQFLTNIHTLRTHVTIDGVYPIGVIFTDLATVNEAPLWSKGQSSGHPCISKGTAMFSGYNFRFNESSEIDIPHEHVHKCGI